MDHAVAAVLVTVPVDVDRATVPAACRLVVLPPGVKNLSVALDVIDGLVPIVFVRAFFAPPLIPLLVVIDLAVAALAIASVVNEESATNPAAVRLVVDAPVVKHFSLAPVQVTIGDVATAVGSPWAGHAWVEGLVEEAASLLIVEFTIAVSVVLGDDLVNDVVVGSGLSRELDELMPVDVPAIVGVSEGVDDGA